MKKTFLVCVSRGIKNKIEEKPYGIVIHKDCNNEFLEIVVYSGYGKEINYK